jgi:3-hydroxyacyl-CoA dehydrogenase/enoyl-CoA hydratase/3-hydroxybutyryl-CoA epimerase
MIGTFWHGLNAIKSGASRPKELLNGKRRKSVFWCRYDGCSCLLNSNQRVPVVLKDVSVENAEKGKAYSKSYLINVFHKVV